MGRIILPNNMLAVTQQMAGFFSITKTRNGEVTQHIPEFQNVITNIGLWQFAVMDGDANGNGYGAANTVNFCCAVGSGSATPQITDTSITAFVAEQVYNTGMTGGYVETDGTNPPYWYHRLTYTFATGAAAGNLTEIVTYPQKNSAGGGYANSIFCHSLIKDSNGNPTTITVLSDEVLTVTYEIRFYINTADKAFSFNLNGSPVTGVYRPYAVTGFGGVGLTQSLYYGYGGSNIIFSSHPMNAYNGGALIADVGSLNTTDPPTGATIVNDPPVNDIVNSGTCFADLHYTVPTQVCNGTINTIAFTRTPMFSYQFGNLSTPIVKNSGQRLIVSFRSAWGRYP